MKSKLNRKYGISLIVLVITIIVMIILATVIILSLSSDNILGKSKDTVVITNLKNIQEYLDVEKSNDVDISGYNSLSDLKVDVPEEYNEWLGIHEGVIYIKATASDKYKEIGEEYNIKVATEKSGEDVVVINSTEDDSSIVGAKIYGTTDASGNSVGESGTIELIVTQNLINNGYSEEGNIFGVVGTRITDDKPSKSIASIRVGNYNTRVDLTNPEYIPIDLKKSYTISFYAKDNGQGASYYFGCCFWDYDKKHIDTKNTTYKPGTLTYLTEDLESGDTVIHVKSTDNWTTLPNTIIFWNYVDGSGYEWPAETYSRNVFDSKMSSIDSSNNTIVLTEAWSGDTIKKGTEISQIRSSDEGTYIYTHLLDSKLNTTWTKYEATIKGVTPPANVTPTRYMRNGARYMKFILLHDIWWGYSNPENSPTIAWYSNFIMSEAKNYENKYVINLNGKDPLRSMEDGTRDYLDLETKQIVRNIGVDASGNLYKLSNPEYEDVTVPVLPCYNTNTIVTVNDAVTTNVDVYYYI